MSYIPIHRKSDAINVSVRLLECAECPLDVRYPPSRLGLAWLSLLIGILSTPVLLAIYRSGITTTHVLDSRERTPPFRLVWTKFWPLFLLNTNVNVCLKRTAWTIMKRKKSERVRVSFSTPNFGTQSIVIYFSKVEPLYNTEQTFSPFVNIYSVKGELSTLSKTNPVPSDTNLWSHLSPENLENKQCQKTFTTVLWKRAKV